MRLGLIKLNRLSRSANLIVLLGILIIYFLFYWKTEFLTAGFRYFIDDHQIPTIQYDLEQNGFFNTISAWIEMDRGIPRFRPFYYINLISATAVFQLHATVWAVYTCLLASFTTFFLFLFTRLQGFSISLSLLFAVVTLWGAQAEIWARLSIPEAPGTFFLSLSLVLAILGAKPSRQSRFLDISLIISVLLSSLYKEVFILFIPALVAIRIHAYSRLNQVSIYQAVRANWKISAVMLVIAAIETLYIKFFIGTKATGYAGFDSTNLKLNNLIITTKTLAQAGLFELLLLSIFLLLVITLAQKQSLLNLCKQLLPSAVIFLLIVVPQILIYAKSGIGGYYLVPGIIGFALLTVEVLNLLQQRLKFLGYIAIALTFSVLLWSTTPVMWTMYNRIAQDSFAMNSLFQKTLSCKSQEDPILIALNPRVRYEVAVAVKRVMNYVYREDNLVLATYGLEKTDFPSDTLKEAEQRWEFLNPEEISNSYNNSIRSFQDKSKLETIVVFDHLNEDFIRTSQDWFNPRDFEQTDYEISFAPASLYCRK